MMAQERGLPEMYDDSGTAFGERDARRAMTRWA
jgi:hypothetical protein